MQPQVDHIFPLALGGKDDDYAAVWTSSGTSNQYPPR